MGQTSVPETLVAHQKLKSGNNPKTFKHRDDQGGSVQLHIQLHTVLHVSKLISVRLQGF